jgi:DNA-directed RNA polymerase specialized sigma24 family protein
MVIYALDFMHYSQYLKNREERFRLYGKVNSSKQQELFDEVLEQIPIELHRKVLLSRFIGGKTYQQIADQYDIKVFHVRKIMNRIFHKFENVNQNRDRVQ